MASKKTTEETNANALAGADLLRIVQSTTTNGVTTFANYKVALSAIKTFILNGLTVAAAAISDSTAAGRAMLTASNAAAQTALLNPFTSALKGLVPPSGGGTTMFLRADGWSALPTTLKNNFTATQPPTAADDGPTGGYSVGSSWLVSLTGDMWRARSVAANAARWVKVDVADHPGYIPNRWYVPFGHGVPAIVAGGAANTIYAAFGVLKQRITIGQLAARVSTAASGGNFQLAVYYHNPALGCPGPLIINTASGSTSTATQVPLAANATIECGPIWVCTNTDNAATVFIALGLSSPAHISVVGNTGSAIPPGVSNASQATGLSTPQTFGTWPVDLSNATWSNATIGRNPMVEFMVASVP